MSISPLQVMQSAAGYYVGHGYSDPDMGMAADCYALPYSRETGYFATKEEAQQVLIQMEAEQIRLNNDLMSI